MAVVKEVRYLTEKQKRFCDEYIIDLNATRAYKSVYKDVQTDEAARACASRLLTYDNVKSYIKEQLDTLHDERTADAQEVIAYLTSVMRGKSEAEVVVIEGQGEGYSKAKRFKKAPDERERLKAAEMLGKRYGIFDKNNAEKDSEGIKAFITAAVPNTDSVKELFNNEET